MPLPTYVTAPKAPTEPLANKDLPVFDQAAEEVPLAAQVHENDGVFDQEQDRRAANE